MCVHPSAPPGFDVSIYMAGLHACMSLNCMYIKVQHGIQAILCNKHNTDLHNTDDYMVV